MLQYFYFKFKPNVMTLFNIILVVHILAGAIALILGTIIMIKRKGNKTHKKLGRIFGVAMLISAFLSFLLSIMHQNIFLFCIGILTIHLVGTGWRFLFLKNLPNGQKLLWVDWFLFVFMLAFGILFVYLGIINIAINNFFGIAPLAFGILGLLNLFSDFRIFVQKKYTINFSIRLHIQRMSGAYIASFTAFLVNVVSRNLEHIPFLSKFTFLTWISPGILVIPLIFRWSKKYKSQLN